MWETEEKDVEEKGLSGVTFLTRLLTFLVLSILLGLL